MRLTKRRLVTAVSLAFIASVLVALTARAGEPLSITVFVLLGALVANGARTVRRPTGHDRR
jgi:heme O synthase-like polyprenyltransferase